MAPALLWSTSLLPALLWALTSSAAAESSVAAAEGAGRPAVRWAEGGRIPPPVGAHIVSVLLASSRGDGSLADAVEAEEFALDHSLQYLGPVGALDGYHRFVAADGPSAESLVGPREDPAHKARTLARRLVEAQDPRVLWSKEQIPALRLHRRRSEASASSLSSRDVAIGDPWYSRQWHLVGRPHPCVLMHLMQREWLNGILGPGTNASHLLVNLLRQCHQVNPNQRGNDLNLTGLWDQGEWAWAPPGISFAP
jgi:hypothetical protein